MNKTFKVVFNKARGALIAVNEATSSVQKKGTKTVVAAVACLATGVAFAAVDPNDAQYVGKGAFVTWNGDAPSAPDANPIVMTGAQAQAIGSGNWVSVVKSSVGATGTMNNLDINLSAKGPNSTPNPDKQLIMVHSQGGTINFGGDKLNVVATTDFIGGGNNQLAAIYSEANAGNSMGISAQKVNIDLASTASDGKSIYGVSSLGGKVNITSDVLNIKLKTSTERSDTSQYSETAGISAGTFGNFEKFRGYVGDITTSANTAVDVNVESTTAMATKPNNDTEFGGGSPVFGIRSEGGSVNLAGTNKVTATANGADARGVYAVNYAYNSTLGLQRFNSELTVNNLTAKVTSKTGKAYGVHAKNNADLNTVAVNLTGDVDISASSTNSQGIYADGKNVKMDVGEDGKTVSIIATGKDARGIMTDTGAVLNVKGSSITVSATDESGRGISAWDGSTINIGNEQTETVKVDGNDAGIMSVAKGATVHVVSKKIVVNSSNFGVHVQNNTETPVAPTEHATVKLKADEITINSKSLGLSAFSNGQMDVTGNLTVRAENAIDVRGNSTMNINTDGKHTTVLNGNVVFETPNSPSDSQNSGKIINAFVNVGLHGADSEWTGRSFQEYKVDGKYVQVVELEADPYHGNVTGFKTEISNGGKWNVTGDSFVNTLTLENGGVVRGGNQVKKLSVQTFAVKGAGNVFMLDAKTNLNGTITFADKDSELITNLVTAYTDVQFSEQEANGAKVSVLDGANGKLKVNAQEGGTLSVIDSFTYSSAGLSSLADAYKGLTLKLDNASLYVAPKKPDETGSTIMNIPASAEVTLPTQGGNDISGGADNFKIQGTVNIVANEGTGTVKANNKATLSSVNVEGSTVKPAVLNLHEVEATADAITVKNATLAVGSVLAATAPEILKTASLDVTDLVAEDGASVLVGNDQAQGLVKVNKFSSKAGSIVFADPSWSTDPSLNTVSNASGMAVAEVSGDINGTVAAGRNSFFAFGTDLATAQKMVEKVTTWGASATGAAVVVATPIAISSTGMVIADASATSVSSLSGTAGSLTVATNSALVVDQNAATGTAPLVNGTVAFKTGSTLGIVNADEGKFTLASTVTDATNAKVVTDNPFLSGKLDGTFVTMTFEADEGLKAIASTGIQAMTRRADFTMAQTIADRASVDQELEPGMNLWVDLAGETYKSDDLDHGGDFEADVFYGAFGGDVKVADDYTVGAAFQYGTGTLRSGVSAIKNAIDNYGLSLYGTAKYGSAKILGELAYVWGENDITSAQTALNGSVDTTMYSAGVTGMYELQAGGFTFVPSIGVRVSRLETDAMQVGAFRVEDQDQTLVQIPIALRINGADMAAGGWKFAPSFKIAYVPTFGDKEIEVLGHETDVIDTNPVQIDFGVRAGTENLLVNAAFAVGAGHDGTSSVGGKVGIKYAF